MAIAWRNSPSGAPASSIRRAAWTWRQAPAARIWSSAQASLSGAQTSSWSQQARGAFIAFCDQDDVWAPDKLACALDQILAAGACLHVHAARLIDEAGAPLGEFRQAIAMPRIYEPLE